MLVSGETYAKPAQIALDALITDSPFDILVSYTEELDSSIARHPRIILNKIPALNVDAHRSQYFLRKFEALEHCLNTTVHDYIIQLDADVVLARPLNEQDIIRALSGKDYGMVEQTGIRGTDMDRAAFLNHYTNYTLKLLDPYSAPPHLESFRYFNSGIVIGTRMFFMMIVSWALDRIRHQSSEHQVGKHMIADQDYFQYWANTMHPGTCQELPWYWNHCEHWDRRFPQPGVLFAHYSNFCLGPKPNTTKRMETIRRPWRRLFNQISSNIVTRT